MNKIKADCIFIIMTFCHGLITFLFLGGMPIITFGIFNVVTATGFLLWAFYAGILYLIIRKWIMEENIIGKQIFFALIFSVGAAFAKGVFDLAVRQAENYMDGSFLMVAFVDEMITCFFGMILLFLLFKLTGYEKNTDWKAIKSPFIMVTAVLVAYLSYTLYYLWRKQEGIARYHATEEQISNLDHYLAVHMVIYNPWFYVLFFIAFWWLMRRMFPKKKKL